MDYENPFSAINPSDFGGNPGGPGFVNQWQTSVATEKAEMAKPFIQMMKQRDEMELQKKQMEMGEFSSPEAVAARRQRMLLEGEKAGADRQRIAPELARDIEKAKQEVAQFGPEAKAKIAQADKIAADIKNEPIKKFFAAAADYGGILNASKADPLTKAADYKQFIKDFKDQNPDITIPPNMEQWSANTGRYLAQAKLVSLHSVAHEQELEKAHVAADATVEGHRISSAGTVRAAEITAGASEKNSERIYGSKSDQSDIKIEQLVTERLRRDTRLSTMGTRALLTKDPKEKQALNDEIAQRESEIEQGVRNQFKSRTASGSLSQEDIAKIPDYNPNKFEYRRGGDGSIQSRPKKR